MSGGYVSADALRGYITTLRNGRNFTQQQLADAIRMAKRTYISWETGHTKDIKTPYLLRALKVLNGSVDQVAELVDSSTKADGEGLAKDWLAQNPQILRLAEEVVRHEPSRERLAIGLEVVADLVRRGLVVPSALEQIEDLLSSRSQ